MLKNLIISVLLNIMLYGKDGWTVSGTPKVLTSLTITFLTWLLLCELESLTTDYIKEVKRKRRIRRKIERELAQGRENRDR